MSSEQLLDNLAEACDNMMTMLDEHGGAYRKYMQQQADKQDKHIKKAQYYDQAADATSNAQAHEKMKEKSNDEMGKADEIFYKNSRYLAHNTPSKSIAERLDTDKKASNPANSDKYYTNRAKAEANFARQSWKHDHGDTGEDKLAAREPGTFKKLQDQKKAIKETCLYILSILDEI